MSLIEELAEELDVNPDFLKWELTKLVPREKTIDDTCPTCGAWFGSNFDKERCYSCGQKIGDSVF